MRWLYSLLVAICLFCGWQIATAASAIYSLAAAVELRDADAILRGSDIPSIRRSITQQIVGAYLAGTPAGKKPSPHERLLTTTYGSSVIDAYVSRLLAQENLIRFLHDGTIAPPPGADDRVILPSVNFDNAVGSISRIRLHSPLKFSLRVSPENAERVAIVMRSTGIKWKLAGVELPLSTVRAISDSARKPPTS